MNENLYARMRSVFDQHGSRDALRLPGGGGWSYEVLDAAAGRAAAVLRGYGVRPGDRVLAQVDKHPESLALYLGCLQSGAVYVPLNTAYTHAEVAYFIEDAQPRLFVHREGDSLGDVSCVCASIGAGATGSFSTAMSRSGPSRDVAQRGAEDLAAIVYTSGTTGRSKGAMLSHGNLSSNADSLREAWGWRDDDVLLHALPIFHVHGLFIALHCALLGGTPIVFLERFDAREVLAHLPEITVMMGVPTFYTRLLALAELDAEQVRGVRVIISGSAPLTEQTFGEFEHRTGQRILERYGMSETIINTTNPLVGERVAGSVGFALPGVEMRITDEAGSELPCGEVGAIEVRGENVFSGYWRNPEKTAEDIRANGFFITGDLGMMDRQGRLRIVGRAKDLVISGGYNIYPKEVEACIDEMAGLVESAVIGIPHPDFGEGVVALVVGDNRMIEEQQVLDYLSDRLARFKQPKRVINVAQLPRNAMGKVQKNELRQQYSGLFED
ncbi:MAG: AMP-binding protein [Pseudomonadales bacterium]|jgi:malonyl-CoA/methylmalonyl-CoA synthetase|nr:AMP-binding protein [Pseudomonadales bacterium]MDP6472853.1 AMP-binding protein [Pseudomonadales bacterium]MDP6826391.1 AMP-binding protein [Pseudomonadales bacterium]MDP6972527.1 AMP-binding protein [Pseudomonadales bacterium]|tara:strand:- start:262 stop:1755 length:1494 start_codon:yes stop_codon:yes gene_type:complete